MSFRLVMFNRIPRFFPQRHYATSLAEYESLYEILECDPTSSKTEIRESWLRLSMMHHPDLNQDSPEANEKFLKIKDAYKILNNDEKRKQYNEKIGFHHFDPPPDYHHEWSMEGEKNKIAAREYYKWDEAKIKELMSSDKLREVNWKDKTPSDRYRILMEEEDRIREAEDIKSSSETPGIWVLIPRFTVIFSIAALLVGFAYRVNAIEGSDEVLAARAESERLTYDTTIRKGTTFISGAARKNHIGADNYSLMQPISGLRMKQKEKENNALESVIALETPDTQAEATS